MPEAWNAFPTKVKLKKSTMLKSKPRIARLFDEGLTFYKPPLLIKYRGLGAGVHCRYMVSVSKKRFPKAVDRNRVKRLLREAIRQSGAIEPSPQDIVLVFVGNKKPEFKHIRKAWVAFLKDREGKTTQPVSPAEGNEPTEHPA